MRKFYLLWQDRVVQISQKPSGKLPSAAIRQTPSGKSAAPFTLSWSHYVLLLTIKNPEERSFYEIEATQSGWSVPELKRQLNSGLYERLALSRNNEQYRIVGKVDELMTLCDRLEAQLNTIQTESRRLLEAVLLDALNSAAA